MANWCYSGITFYSENEEQVNSAHARFVEIRNGTPTTENGFGQGWMGDYANVFLPQYGHEKVDCRGQVAWIDDDVNKDEEKGIFFFHIETETAWDGKLGMWQKILEDFYPDINIAYVAEECGNGYFLKWDKTGRFYNEQYCVDGCLPGKKPNEYVYLSDAFDGSGTVRNLDQIQADIDKVTTLKYTHADNERDLEENINAAISEIDDEELYFTIEKYEEVAPSDFSFLR